MQISTILDQIDLGAMALPEFQRGYVWSRKQVHDLMTSLYLRYPVGGLLVWVTKTENADARGNQQLTAGNVELILDGQQRISTLYGILRGVPPPFFDGDATAFTDLYFNMESEVFEFYGPVKMRDNALWISVTELMRNGLGPFITRLNSLPDLQPHLSTYINRLNQLMGIQSVPLHIEKVTGADKTVEVVVTIFNMVNSGGTKLSQGDLALARVCAGWPDARRRLRESLLKWKKAGFHFEMDWLLRNINTLLTGEARFTALSNVSPTEFQQGHQQTEKMIDYLLNVIGGRLGLDHDRVLGGVYAFPVMGRFLAQQGGKFSAAAQRDKLLYWYSHTLLWGRYSSQTEAVLNQDLDALEVNGDKVDALIRQLTVWRGALVVRPENFAEWSRGARFYPMLYMLTRMGEAKDWDNGLPLKVGLLGKTSGLQVHHIFPKSQLYHAGFSRAKVNALANYCFLTQTSNLAISDTVPEIYFEQIEKRYPGALASQWIPMDRRLWRMENYLEFLAAREQLLAEAANGFLAGLLAGAVSTPLVEPPTVVHSVAVEHAAADEDELELLQLNAWVAEPGLTPGQLYYEITDEGGAVQAILDLAWPIGVQAGYSEPVAFVLENEIAVLGVASQAGFRCFTTQTALRSYIEETILAQAAEPVMVHAA
jgi:hypothetical protein